MGKTVEKIFTEEELKRIPELYKSGTSVRHLLETFKTSGKKIKSILFDAGIDINDGNCEFLNRKPRNYWNNKERCEEAAKTCRNRAEFQDKYSAAFAQAKKSGWLEDFDKYFSLEKLYYKFEDPIHYVYSYEFADQKSVYVGRTTNIKRRHTEHKNGTMYMNKKVYTDTVYNFASKNSLVVPEPKILETNLNAVESQKKEDEWCKHYESSGWTILNKATTGKGSGSLGARLVKWNYDACKDAASQCVSKIDFKTRFGTAYRVSTQNHWIDEFFNFNLLKDKGYLDSLENCIEESKKYKSMSDIKYNYPFLYHKICKMKWNDDIRKANGWFKLGEVKKDRLMDTRNIGNEKKVLGFIKLELDKLNEFEKVVYYKLCHYDLKVLDDTVYGCRFNVLLNNELVVGFDTLKTNLEFKNGMKHVVFLNELIKYNELGYPMFHVFESDLEYGEIVWDKIDNALGLTKEENKINGRDCEVREIYKYDADTFLNLNHIQGECAASCYLGAFYQDELVAVMCLRLGGSSCREGWELVRFAGKINYHVRGIGGKLFNYFVEKYNAESVTSFCDRRFLMDMNNNLYTNIGFKLDSINRPDFMYVNANAVIPRVYHKMLLNRKKMIKKCGFSEKMTETEMVKELGYDRIWNCGLIKYVWESQDKK